MPYQPEFIQKLDREQSREIQNTLSQVLSVSFPDNSSMQVWLEKRQDWVAVPTSATDDFTDFASAVLRIAEDSSYRELLGVFLETEANEPVAFSVPSNIDGISEFNIESPPSHKVLFAGAPDWVILMAEADFYVVAGPVSAVEKFLNLSVDQAFTKFENYIESWKFPEEFAERLQPLKDVPRSVYRNTLERYQNAPFGSRVNLYD